MIRAGVFFLTLAFPIFGLTFHDVRPFRLHLPSEPANLDPQKQRSSASSYLLQNLHRSLFSFDDDKGLVPDLAEARCERPSPTKLRCRLKPHLKWSDGKDLVAEDFARPFRRLADPKENAPRADIAFQLKNGREVFAGKAKPTQLGVRVIDARTVEFELATPTNEFEWLLASTLTAPFRPPGAARESLVTTGPYRIMKWESGRSVTLQPNFHYPGGTVDRPPVEMLFVDEDETALRLYQKKQLDLLRRLPTLYIPRHQKSPDFHWIPVTRLDYLGFGPRLKDQPQLREALALSLDYKALQALFHSEGVPGCPGLPESWFPSGQIPCHTLNSARAKTLARESKWTGPLLMSYSSLGGEDHRRAAELEQSNWQTHAGLQVRLKSLENKIFLSELRTSPPDLFRKGIAVDRPTCLAALENFGKDSDENFLHVNSAEFEKILQELAQTLDETRKKELCLKGVSHLMDNHLLIPLGRMHFAVLASTDFTGWRLNQMNQMDLANLRLTKPTMAPKPSKTSQ